MSDFVIARGDRREALRAVLQDSLGQPVNLVGCTVRFRMREYDDATRTVDAPAVVEDDGTEANRGRVRYDWQPGETDDPGVYYAVFVVTYPDGSQQTFPNARALVVTITDPGV